LINSEINEENVEGLNYFNRAILIIIMGICPEYLEENSFALANKIKRRSNEIFSVFLKKHHKNKKHIYI